MHSLLRKRDAGAASQRANSARESPVHQPSNTPGSRGADNLTLQRDALEREAEQFAAQCWPAHCECGCPGCSTKSVTNRSQPLDIGVRHHFERALGVDLRQIRVHEDQTVRLMGAAAFTRGSDIHFAPSQYRPDTTAGYRLLAHELVHAVQQSPNPPSGFTSASPGSVQKQDAQHIDADALAAQIARDEEAIKAAREVYDALDGWNDEVRALRALHGRDVDMRQRIQDQFLRLYDETLRSYLKDQLGGTFGPSLWLVDAYALLRAAETLDYHTAMGEAILPIGTRDEEVFRILEALPLTGRQAMEREYNLTFGTAGNGEAEKLGQGSLKADLIGDLSGDSQEKAVVLLNRDLTSADELYFDSVAITGTHEDAVISRLQTEWDRGPQAFAQLETDWNAKIKGQTNDASDVWTDFTLYEAMDDELSGEDWLLVKAVLDAYEAYKKGLTPSQTATDEDVLAQAGTDARQPVSEDTLKEREDILLTEARRELLCGHGRRIHRLGNNRAAGIPRCPTHPPDLDGPNRADETRSRADP